MSRMRHSLVYVDPLAFSAMSNQACHMLSPHDYSCIMWGCVGGGREAEANKSGVIMLLMSVIDILGIVLGLRLLKSSTMAYALCPMA